MLGKIPEPSDRPVSDAAARPKPRGGLIAVISGFSMVYNQISSALMGVFLAHLLGAADYGTVNLARSLFVIAVFLAPMGLDLALQRHFGQSKSPDILSTELAWLRILTVGFAVLIFLCFFLGGAALLEHSVFPHAGFGAVLTATMIALPFNTDLAVLGGAYRGIYKPLPSLVAAYLMQPTLRIAAILLLSLFLTGIWATVFGTTISFVLAWIYIALTARRDFSVGRLRLDAAFHSAISIFRYSPVMGLATFSYTMARTLDSMTLGAFGTAADVGRYAVVLMMCQLVGTIGGSLGQTLGTSIASAAATGKNETIVAALRQNMNLSGLLSAPFCVVIAVWGSNIDLILGPSYAIPLSVFAIAAATQWIFTVTHNCSSALTMTGRHNVELGNNMVAVVIELIGCLVLIPSYGLTGAAVATFIMVATLNVIRQVQIGRIFGNAMVHINLLFPLVLSAVVAAPIALIGQHIGERTWWSIGILVSCHLILSFLAIFFFAANKDQKRQLRKLVRL